MRRHRATAVVKVAFNKKLKKAILVDARGFTLYMYTADSPWHPVLLQRRDLSLLEGVAAATDEGIAACGARSQGVLARDGEAQRRRPQVTYKGHPLYTNAGAPNFGLVADKKPGDVNGQRFLEIWLVLSPAGTPIRVRG